MNQITKNYRYLFQRIQKSIPIIIYLKLIIKNIDQTKELHFCLCTNNKQQMPRHKQHSFNEFHLPEIKRNTETITKNTSTYSQNHSILSRFEQQLKSSNKKYNTVIKEKKRVYRMKTTDVSAHQTFDDLRKELRSIKEQVNYNMKQYNHKVENKFEDFALLSALKKDNHPQVVYQPMPMYYPMHPMQHPIQPQMPLSSLDYQQIYPNLPLPRKKIYSKPSIFAKNRLKKFRKHVHAVLFTIRLRKFVAKVIKHKKQMFNKYLYNTNEFKQEAGQIKKIFIEGMKTFLVTLLQKQDSQIRLYEEDSENFTKQKLITTRKLIELLTQCLRKTVESMPFEACTKSVYYFCRHGSFACAQKLLTHEELQNMSVSEKNFYLQADKSLQKSQIINYLFMKIIIYNILGQSWKIDADKFDKDKQILQQNILIVTSIFYELLMDIQDDLIVHSPECYKLNNYLEIKDQNIYPSESLTIKPGQFRKNQIISGLINQNVIKNTYNLEKTWNKEKNKLIQIIELVHRKIVNYHKKLIKPFF